MTKVVFGLRLAFHAFAFLASFFFFYQRLLHCSWDMNSALRQMNSIFCVNSNPKIIFLFFSIFNKISGIQMHPNCILHMVNSINHMGLYRVITIY